MHPTGYAEVETNENDPLDPLDLLIMDSTSHTGSKRIRHMDVKHMC